MNKPLFTFIPTGVLYKTTKEAQEAKEYGMYLQVDSSGLVSQSQPIDTRILKPKQGWCQSNEPEKHLDQVAEDLCRGLIKSNSNILLFSYKDTSLLERIKLKKTTSVDFTYRYSDKAINSTWPEDDTSEEVARRISYCQNKYDLIICRHYLEHYDEPLKIVEAMIEKLSDCGQIYIEVPDCSLFFKRKNPLFMWEHHKKYFTKRSLLLLMSQLKLNCKIKTYGESIEPSICCIMNTVKSAVNLNDRKETKTSEIGKGIIEAYVENWGTYFQTNKERKALLGIGHNSDRFIQITKSEDKFDWLVDYDPNKAGMYIGKSSRAIVSELDAATDEHFIIILGVHDRSFYQVRDKLSRQYRNARILSIFNMHDLQK